MYAIISFVVQMAGATREQSAELGLEETDTQLPTGMASQTELQAEVQRGPSIAGNLAYRLFDGVDVKFQYCMLKDSGSLDSLPSTEWHDQTADVMQATESTQVGREYTYVPGTAFKDAHPPHADKDGRYVGYCYRSKSTLKIKFCMCSVVRFKGEDLSWVGDGAEQGSFTGCKETRPLPTAAKGASELTFGEGLTARAVWAHPRSLWVEAGPNDWCEMTMQLPAQSDSSVRHAMPYCVMAGYAQNHSDEATAHGKQVDQILHYLYWAAAYDQESPTGWFRASQAQLKQAWADLAAALGGSRSAYAYPGDDRPRVVEVLKIGRKLCKTVYALATDAWKQIEVLYEEYMKDVRLEGADKRKISDGSPPSGQKPLFVIAAGPPSSGKSIASMSPQDFELIMQKTGGPREAHFAFKGRSYEGFQAGTVELNVDRIVEASDLSDISKQHMAARAHWVRGLQNVREASAMASMQQEVGQREYWFLRKAAGIDDLSNAHIQRTLAMGQDCIYETLLGDNWMDWGLKFDLPKIKAAGYEILLIDYVVPVDELVQRAFEREKRTGQTPAPTKQIEKDALAAPTNFMKPQLLKLVDYGISMSHVRRGQVEDVLAVFRNRDGEGCFTHCADGATLERYDAKALRRCSRAKCR